MLSATTGFLHRVACLAVALSIAAFAAASARAQEEQAPTRTPVKWDQARVTQYAKQLNTAVDDAMAEIRKSPTQHNIAQRQVWYDMKETIRLLQNSTGRLMTALQKGEGEEETRATFDRIESLRKDAEETGRKSAMPDPVLNALVKAGSIHNQMRPYYLGKG